MKAIRIKTPLAKKDISKLRVGDEVLLSGTIFTARDAAHERFFRLIKNGKHIPLDLDGSVLYYAGPTPPKPGKAIGSCGPTTSSRMDPFTPHLIKLGLTGMIGKGERSKEVRDAIRRHGAVYFLATGGIGALLCTKVKSSKVVLYKDLGPEAVYRLEVEDFPLIVGIDAKGNDIYGKAKWKKA